MQIVIPDGSTAVLMSVDEFDSLQDTMISWAQPGILDDLAQADRDYFVTAVPAGSAQRG